MSKKFYITLLVACLLLLGVAAYFADERTPAGPTFTTFNATTTPDSTNGGGLSTFVSDAYQFGIAFPKKYFVSAREMDATSTPNLMVVLLLDTKENRDVIAGKVASLREGDTGITVNVHRNSANLSPSQWAMTESNWNVSDKNMATTTLAGADGVVFRWSGLFPGATLVTRHGDFMYILAVSWKDSDDPIIRDFEQILSSFRFGSGG